MAEKVKAYKIRRTPSELKKLEQRCIETSKLYRWLREDLKVSKKVLAKQIKVRYCNIYQTFEEPEKYLTLERIFIIKKLLKDKTLKEILVAIAPSYETEWYNVKDDDLDLFQKRLEGKI